MLNRIISELRADALHPTRLARRARRRVSRARGDAVERLWTLETEALARAEGLLDEAPELPVLSRVTDAVERIVHQRLESVTAPPVDGYDELNAKEVREHLRGLDRLALAKLRRHEAGGKNRKSVLQEIDREIARQMRRFEDVADVAEQAVQSAVDAVPEAAP